ncbi:MAG: SDR family NAD(P)-dependent oxidoreductase [Rhodospirillaceae bacterium]|jgi:NAD(P)-dependent dehydrogenase (short-subunit alcohol dehydrogenase family)|nr:SDR family NAD(P)-dependent oxidoreductase [Rhodospirillaceae bacterium]MBT3887280.1 SDR family NAD(P)-dependent oxidoreductase [Rhodospirillaceae bacterium]MBT4117640.1 SDR family NAD(P)-dependent oxidoreductase [Rhodospirillaceae bacterium]MBT4670789.1 SDR family NAD(P)-dependent oxidoreductase [Rhodospirillaceae bacterium]MBT4718067.1 SDR family NAD(P)-dependent oxidoreductase [Rhodospirillaceae bacterium]
MDVSGIAAIVTGGASGLGEATARSLAEKGALVSIFDLNEDKGNKVAADIGGDFLSCDVASEASVQGALDAAKEKNGVARILINCAGIAAGSRTVGRDGAHSLELYTKIVTVNLIGTFNMTRLFAVDASAAEPLNDDGERGVVVMTASVAAYEGQIGQVAYSASKGGIVGMTVPIARDLSSRGVRVCTIAPGVLLTPLADGLPQEALDALNASVPFPQRMGHASEYAQLALHICENGYLNGETIRIDGALRMAPR